MRKKISVLILISSFFLPQTLKAVPLQQPWYTNGWKFAAASYGFWAACSASIAAYLYINSKKLTQQQDHALIFDPRLKEELKISKAAAPFFLGAGVGLALAAGFLYRHGARQ